jgi:hypothetical protein
MGGPSIGLYQMHPATPNGGLKVPFEHYRRFFRERFPTP